MSTTQRVPQTSPESDTISKLLSQYGCGPIEFTGTPNALYERHLVFDNVVDLAAVGPRERFEAIASSVRDILSQRWVRTENRYARENPKRVYVFTPLRDTLLAHGDYYMHLADLKSCLKADQRLCELYADPDAWARRVILNVAGSGKFSSDRTIAEYSAEIWRVKPCPVL